MKPFCFLLCLCTCTRNPYFACIDACDAAINQCVLSCGVGDNATACETYCINHTDPCEAGCAAHAKPVAVDAYTPPANFSSVCSSQTFCALDCVDLDNDPFNCGTCANACKTTELCQRGACQCTSKLVACGQGACIDSANDPNNCGACGLVCSSGSCADGLCVTTDSKWPILGGDVHHSGWNRVETAHPPGAPKWSMLLAPNGFLSAPVAVGGQVFVSATQYGPTEQMSVFALDVATGQVSWSHDFSNVFYVGQPTFDAATLYVETSDQQSPSFLYAFDAGNGAKRWSLSFDTDATIAYKSPLVVASNIYFDTGNEVLGIADTSGKAIYDADFGASESLNDGWSAMLLDGKIFTMLGDYLYGLDVVMGNNISIYLPVEIPHPATPLSDGDSLYVVLAPSVYAVKPTASQPQWTQISDNVLPAVDDKQLYAVAHGDLAAYDTLNGALKWTFSDAQSTPAHSLHFSPIVAAGFVYVASDTEVYAVDTASGTSVWSTSPGGALAIAEGTLFVAQPDGTLAAYALTP